MKVKYRVVLETEVEVEEGHTWEETLLSLDEMSLAEELLTSPVTSEVRDSSGRVRARNYGQYILTNEEGVSLS